MTVSTIQMENILYTTDLSENARYAFTYAMSMADRYEAKLILLHVLPEESDLLDKHVIGYISEDQWTAIKESHYQDAKEALIGKRRDRALVGKILDRFSEKARADFGDNAIPSDEIIVKRGNPVEIILETAQEKECDLIVMGTHGRGALADAMLGSTARRVVRRSQKPVLMVRLPEAS
jgi:nucleotide-binding universal stress UspA family protein